MIRRILSNAGAWVLDYLYVVQIEFRNILTRPNPRRYRSPFDTGGFKETEVVLIPGVYEDWRFMKPVADRIHKEGYKIHVLEGLGYNRGTVEAMARLADEYIQEHVKGSYVVVAHSKGGLIGKYLLMSSKNKKRLKRVVAISTPFSGSQYAYLLPPLPSLKVFRPNSELLVLLNGYTNENRKIVSIYGTFDPHIPGGSSLAGAENVRVAAKGHFKILASRNVHNIVVSHLVDFTSQ